MRTPIHLTYLRHALNSEAHPDSPHHEPSRPCDGCIWVVDSEGEEWLLWTMNLSSGPVYTIHRLDPRYSIRTDYGDIEVVGLHEKSTSEL